VTEKNSHFASKDKQVLVGGGTTDLSSSKRRDGRLTVDIRRGGKEDGK